MPRRLTAPREVRSFAGIVVLCSPTADEYTQKLARPTGRIEILPDGRIAEIYEVYH